jgi:hypothetical protein
VKVSKNKSRIIGLILTEARVGIMEGLGLSVQARFALLDEESNMVADAPRTKGFSPKVQEAVTALIDALEEDQMRLIFGEEPEVPNEPDPISPKDIPTF